MSTTTTAQPNVRDRYVLTDGCEVFARRMMTAEEVADAHAAAAEFTDGNLYWTLATADLRIDPRLPSAADRLQAEIDAWKTAENALRDALAYMVSVRKEVEANTPSLSLGSRQFEAVRLAARAAVRASEAQEIALRNA